MYSSLVTGLYTYYENLLGIFKIEKGGKWGKGGQIWHPFQLIINNPIPLIM